MYLWETWHTSTSAVDISTLVYTSEVWSYCEKTSQDASDVRCSARYMCIGNFHKTLNLITNNKLKHDMHLLIIRSTIKRAKNVAY